MRRRVTEIQDADREASAPQEEERARQREQRKEDARRRLGTMDELHRLIGRQFEELIASLFRKDRYVVHHCGGSGDEEIDLVIALDQSKDMVQCKRWKSNIGSPVVRDFYGAVMCAAANGFIYNYCVS
jgi:restriction endonuclease Mrr